MFYLTLASQLEGVSFHGCAQLPAYALQKFLESHSNLRQLALTDSSLDDAGIISLSPPPHPLLHVACMLVMQGDASTLCCCTAS